MKAWNNMQAGALGGTLCSLWAFFTIGDVVHTIIMAGIGTLVSFGLSRLLNRIKPPQNK